MHCNIPHKCVIVDLLYGGGNTGKFQFNNVLNLSSKTADGVVRGTLQCTTCAGVICLVVALVKPMFAAGVYSHQHSNKRQLGNSCQGSLQDQGLQFQQ